MSRNLFFLLALAFSLTGCYRMPCEDDYCMAPTTNNPNVTREKASNCQPGVSY